MASVSSPAERLKRANSLPIYRIAQHRSGPVRLTSREPMTHTCGVDNRFPPLAFYLALFIPVHTLEETPNAQYRPATAIPQVLTLL